MREFQNLSFSIFGLLETLKQFCHFCTVIKCIDDFFFYCLNYLNLGWKP